MSDPILGQSLHCECVFDQYTQTNTYTHTQPHPQIITMNPSLLLAQRKKKRNHSVVGGGENAVKSCEHRHNSGGGGGCLGYLRRTVVFRVFSSQDSFKRELA